ncbi:MAG: hypothetical protein ACI9JL_003188 [Paracoccaceae bacterium]|jgi:hypothetical protein
MSAFDLLSAKQMITLHGDDAHLHAAQRTDELLAQGDIEGRRVWQRIQDAVGELQRTEPEAGARAR